MTSFTAHIKKISAWKSGKGEFVEFDEQPGKFWKWGVSTHEVGEEMKCECTNQNMGDTGANLLMSVFEGVTAETQGWSAKCPKQPSALQEMAKSTGAKVAGGIESLPANSERFDAAKAFDIVRGQIKLMQSAIGHMQFKIDKLEKKMGQVEALARYGGQV